MSQYIDGNAGPRVAGELGVVAGGEEQLRGQVLTSHLLRLVDAECLRSQNYVYHAMFNQLTILNLEIYVFQVNSLT